MISIRDHLFHLQTKQTSYVFSVEHDLLIHHYYGANIVFENINHLTTKLRGGAGTAVEYEGKPQVYVDRLPLEYALFGTGDFREPALLLHNPSGGFYSNFKFDRYEINPKLLGPLPEARQADDVLMIILKDESRQLELHLVYKVFEKANIISRYARLINNSDQVVIVDRFFSGQLDLERNQLEIMTFDGAWAKERHVHIHRLEGGIFINDSKCGASSNRHNPLTILKDPQTTEEAGEAFGFNLVYSGNHKTLVETMPNKQRRVLWGISDFGFNYHLQPQESFVSCEAVMSYSNQGLNQLSQHFHDFVNHHIIPKEFSFKNRPVVLNNWEATYFNFNERKIIDLAKKARDVGIELFVLDDGWFGKRNDDRSSLGDWDVNLKKLPRGLKGLADKITAMGMKFGLWVEPEMLNEDSELYRKHPNWAIKFPKAKPSTGRNQMVLDLTNPDVRTFLKTKLREILNSATISYIKWDYNRNITDMYGTTLSNQSEFMHRYILGLYDVLQYLTTTFPQVLFEGCASGGNRFDLGMLCFFPQIWTSDNTDYVERLAIQTGTSYGYPLSVISNHVSTVPNHQTLRTTPLSSRFNLACFGVLGYELNLCEEDQNTVKMIKTQIAFYKQYRHLWQFGRMYRSEPTIFNHNRSGLYVMDHQQNLGIYGFFQILVHPDMSSDVVKINHLSDDYYVFYNLPQKLNVLDFGGLINIVSPIHIKVNGKIHRLLSKIYRPSAEKERYVVHGKAFFAAGVKLNPQFMGTGFNKEVRVIGDFGSRL
ncbi:MAG TPA: alpha-galactosidase, partial [Bacilli bacterium]|nr:alpha-galactosidase [Bacilli bacterium]